MKFVKNNLWALISAVVVLVLLLLYIPLSGWASSVHDAMDQRLQQAQKAQSLDTAKAKIPNNGKDGEVAGPIVPAMADVKKKQIDWIAKQSDQATNIAAKANKLHRVDEQGHPLLFGRDISDFLPEMKGGVDGYDFNEIYRTVMPKYYAELVTTSLTPKNANLVALAQPLTEQDIMQAVMEQQSQQNGGLVAWSGNAGGSANAIALSDDEKKAALLTRASQIKMYVAPDAFQVRSFIMSDPAQKPTESQIFESLVDTWVQHDIVRAIAQTNADAAGIAQSPVKRLYLIDVGASAAGTGIGGIARPYQGNGQTRRMGPDMAAIQAMIAQRSGGYAGGPRAGAGSGRTPEISALGHAASGAIFVGMNPAGTAAAAGAPPGNPAALGFATPGAAKSGSSGPDYAASLTGHTANDRFDVTYVHLTVDVDPSKLNDLISKIYQQNNSYTVLNVSFTALDPVATASLGELYGDTPVVKADISLEVLFFRDWTKPIMPDDIKKQLGLVAATTPGAGGAPGLPAGMGGPPPGMMR